MNTQKLFDLNGKTAIITGGGNGIGKAVCELMSAYGANVVVADLKFEDAQVVSEQLIEDGGKALPVLCKVTQDEDLVNLAKVTVEKFGGIDILVNNAVGPGATRTKALESVLTPEIEAKMLSGTPIKRLGKVEDIAGAVLYFAAPVSEWVSGQVLFVNGGGIQTLD